MYVADIYIYFFFQKKHLTFDAKKEPQRIQGIPVKIIEVSGYTRYWTPEFHVRVLPTDRFLSN